MAYCLPSRDWAAPLIHSDRGYNFSPGPAALPESVLCKARDELLNYRNCGFSVMEMSHRSAAFMEIAQRAEATLRQLLNISYDYAVLFMHGGATMQFSAAPLNLSGADAVVDYIHTGSWSKKAIKEAMRHAQVNIAASNEPDCNMIPPQSDWRLSQNAKYLHYTPNETIHGVEFHWIPDVEVPLVADMSSNILSRPIDVSRFGVIYAGAQKNIGPAGLAIVIVRKDLLGRARENIPMLLNWQTIAESDSMENTPPTFAWYMSGLVFDWIASEGGLQEMERRNRRKAERLYRYIDNSNFYCSPVATESRSLMNVPFTLSDDGLDPAFLKAAAANGLFNLKGHRSVGGMRASIYNAIPDAAVEALIDFMRDFEATNA